MTTPEQSGRVVPIDAMEPDHSPKPDYPAKPDHLAQAVFDSLTAHVAVIDRHGIIVAVNRAWIRFALEHGGTHCAATAVGRDYLAACRSGKGSADWGKDGAGQALAGIEGVLSGALSQFVLEYPCHSPHEQRWFLLYASALGAAGGATLVHINVSGRKRSEQRMVRMAHYDVLTALPNRALFEERLEQILADTAGGGEPFALLFIDLDGFKAINDMHGHGIGDLLLRNIASRLTHCVRLGDTVARLGGDEFTVLLPTIGTARKASVLARTIVAALDGPFSLDGRVVSVSASVGIALYPTHGSTAAQLLERADAAMYNAKRDGTPRFAFADDA